MQMLIIATGGILGGVVCMVLAVMFTRRRFVKRIREERAAREREINEELARVGRETSEGFARMKEKYGEEWAEKITEDEIRDELGLDPDKLSRWNPDA